MSTLAPHTGFQPHTIYGYDAALSAIMGLVFIGFSGPLTDFLGWSLPSEAIFGAGVILLPWAWYNFFVYRLPRVTRVHFAIHTLVDLGWVLLTLSLLLTNSAQMTSFGVTIIVIQAIAVGGVFATKRWAYRPA